MNFILKIASMGSNVFQNRCRSYRSDAGLILRDLDINTIKLLMGGEGDSWRTNMEVNSANDAWADGLMALLNVVETAGVKCYFSSLSNQWGGMLGIRGPSSQNPMPIAEAKTYIDKLAGNNKFGYNFIIDPRIFVWAVDNEPNFDDPYAIQWCIEISDYIRSKGGKTLVACPTFEQSHTPITYDRSFQATEPILRGHVDYLDYHEYGVWEIIHDPTYITPRMKNPDGSINWDSLYIWYRNTIQKNMIGGRGAFPVEKLILGEFGIWRGQAADWGGATFTDEDRRNYYSAIFKAIKEIGIRNVGFHYCFEEKAYTTTSFFDGVFARFGMVDILGDYLGYVGNGNPLPSAEVIKEAYTPKSPLLSILTRIVGPIGMGLYLIERTPRRG